MRKLTGREKGMIIIAGIMLLALFFNYYLQQTAKPIEFVAVSRGNIESIVKVSGLTDSEFSEKIISNAEGIISELTLKEGDRVKAGQKICSLRNPSLREKLLQLNGELKLAKGELETNKNDKILARYNYLRANIADLQAAMEPSSNINGDLISVNVKNGEKVLPGSKDCADAVSGSVMKALELCRLPPDVEIMTSIMKQALQTAAAPYNDSDQGLVNLVPKTTSEEIKEPPKSKEMTIFLDILKKAQG